MEFIIGHYSHNSQLGCLGTSPHLLHPTMSWVLNVIQGEPSHPTSPPSSHLLPKRASAWSSSETAQQQQKWLLPLLLGSDEARLAPSCYLSLKAFFLSPYLSFPSFLPPSYFHHKTYHNSHSSELHNTRNFICLVQHYSPVPRKVLRTQQEC